MKLIFYILPLLFSIGLCAQEEKERQMAPPSFSSAGVVSEESTSPSTKKNEAGKDSKKIIQQSQSAILLQQTRYQATQKNETATTKKKRAALVSDLERTAPNSADYYLNVYIMEGRKNASAGMLKKAYSLNPKSSKNDRRNRTRDH